MAKMMTLVVGSRFHNGALQALLKLAKGEELWLVREPNNAHDKNAVAIHNLDGRKLGYVPKADAPAVARIIDKKIPVRAEASSAGGTGVDIFWEA